MRQHDFVAQCHINIFLWHIATIIFRDDAQIYKAVFVQKVDLSQNASFCIDFEPMRNIIKAGIGQKNDKKGCEGVGALFVFVALMAALGIVYPVCGIAAYRLCGSKKTIREIMAEL